MLEGRNKQTLTRHDDHVLDELGYTEEEDKH